MTIAIGEGMSAADAMVAAIPRLKKYALKLTRDVDAADDLVQDALVRALDRQHLFHPGIASMATWLSTIMHHQYVGPRRWAPSKLVALTKDGELPASAAVPPVQEKRGLLARDLNRALAKLPEQQRQAVVLVGANDMTCSRAAEAIGTPRTTVRMRLFRGREALRHLMDGEISG